MIDKSMKRIALSFLFLLCLTVGWSQTNSKIRRVEVSPGNTVNKRVYEMNEPGITMPRFPGGTEELMGYLRSNIKYPVEAEKKGLEGRVLCAFVVGEDGNISDIEIREGVDLLLDNEAERVVRNMPKWTPGYKDGFPMPVRFILPVTFRLEAGKAKRDSLALKPKNVSGENLVYDVVEQMPSFPDGVKGLIQFLQTNLKYPQESMKKGIQGRVVVSFVVDVDGSVTNAAVWKNVDPLLDAEALRVVRMMPKWTPGINKGKPVKVKYTMPVTFRL